VEEASTYAERDVARLLLDADAEELKDTRHAQLCTFVTSLMVLDAVERLGIEPSYCAGHSLGEYTALTASGALSFDDGVRLVCERAEAMHEAGIDNPGTMAAVLGLDDEDVEIACRRADNDVWVANFNAPGQVVIAGSAEGVAAAGAVARSSAPSGSCPSRVRALHAYMSPPGPAAQGHREASRATPRSRSSPTSALPTTEAGVGEPALAQLTSPVRWKHCLLELEDQGVTDYVELGRGRAHRHDEAQRRRTHAVGRHPGRARQAARLHRRRSR
jgi:[acyl-carrier-protein] S-malonyltransferase